MSFVAWATLIGAWCVSVASPGPDFLAVLRTSAAHGRSKGMFVAAGVATGISAWLLLASTGLSVLFARYEVAYLIARYLGATFLIAFGVMVAWRARTAKPTGLGGSGVAQTEPSDVEATVGEERHGGATLAVSDRAHDSFSTWRAYRLGLFTNLANPKALVFFGALLASLVPHHASSMTRVSIFAVIVAIGLAWFVMVARVASMPKVAAGYQRASRKIDTVVGGLFTAVGVSLFAGA